MRVFDEYKTTELHNYDLDFGYLKADKIVKEYHPAVLGVQEKGHYEVSKVYPNGGKDIVWIVDTPAVEGKESWTEYEDIQVYIPYSPEEIAKKRILELKSNLQKTDYQAIKYAEGLISEIEYESIKTQRQYWRDEINSLQTSYNIV